MMGKLEEIYPIAIEHTKQKVIQDMDRYLEEQDTLPAFEAYISDRFSSYIEQIWMNVWLNKASNEVPRKEKKKYLQEKGYDTEGINHKLINKLFRDELRSYHPFDVLPWLKQAFAENQQEWEQRYVKARQTYFKRKEEERIAEERWKVRAMLHEYVGDFLEDKSLTFYVYVRYYIAKKLAADLQTKPKFKYVEPYMLEERLVEKGSFERTDYVWVADFFKELTGSVHSLLDWGRTHYEYETYYHYYERLVWEYILEFAPAKVMECLSDKLMHDYYMAYGEKMTEATLRGLLREEWDDLEEAFFDEIQEEYLSDLLKLAKIPFDEALHLEIFEKDEEKREQKKAEAIGGTRTQEGRREKGYC